MASDLRRVKSILQELQQFEEERILLDGGQALEDAATDCSGGSKNKWSYSLSDLTLVVPSSCLNQYRGTIPSPLTMLEVSLCVDAVGKCQKLTNPEDPLTSLSVQWRVDTETRVATWRLDSNIGKQETESANFAHPLYHFHFGNHVLEEQLRKEAEDGEKSDGDYQREEMTGKVAYLGSPRLAHPPMDAVLAVDFTLSNFFPGLWHKLRMPGSPGLSDAAERYTKLLIRAQKRFWGPYALAVALPWLVRNNSDFERGSPFPTNTENNAVWPQVVPWEVQSQMI